MGVLVSVGVPSAGEKRPGDITLYALDIGTYADLYPLITEKRYVWSGDYIFVLGYWQIIAPYKSRDPFY